MPAVRGSGISGYISNFFFHNLMTESCIIKLNLLSTNLTSNFIEMMCPECGESGETDCATLWGFEIVCSSYEAHGR